MSIEMVWVAQNTEHAYDFIYVSCVSLMNLFFSYT